MANPIRRLVQLVLDRNAADKTKQDAKEAVGGVEKSLGGLKKVALAVGAALIAAFSVRAIINFGREAVRQARESQVAWNNLRGTVEAAGVSFNEIEQDVRALSSAFQDATVHSGEDYANTLRRLITLTGDVSASTQNMGLVANVAAQYFEGELGPAADLVAKAMNGQVSVLRRLGIEADTAQEALEILAERSMGAAERQTETFSGKLAQLNNLWDDFAKHLGFVLIESEGTIGALDVLTGAVEAMANWVEENEERLRSWLANGLKVVITVADGTYRAVRGLAEILAGVFSVAVGAAAGVVAGLADAVAVAASGIGRFARFIGFEGPADAIDGFTEKVANLRDRLKETAIAAIEAGDELMKTGGRRFVEPAFTGLPTSRRERDGSAIFGQGPVTARGLTEEDAEKTEKAAKKVKEEVDRVAEAMSAFDQRMEVTRIMSSLLGDEFDALQAEASALNQVMMTLAAEGIDENDERMKGYAERLREVRTAMDETVEGAHWVTEAHEQMGGVVAMAMSRGLGAAAAGKARMNLIESAELAIRGVIASMNPFTAALAPGYFTGAAKHAAIAGAWKAASAAFGGSGGGGVAVGGGSASLSGARGVSGAPRLRARHSPAWATPSR
jgi:hypothetical protein